MRILWQSKLDKNIKNQTQLYSNQNQTQLCSPAGILDNCKINCVKLQRSSMLQTQLCKVQRSSLLQTQRCKSTTLVLVANSTVQSTQVVLVANSAVQKYNGRPCCKRKGAKVQRLSMLRTQQCKSTK